MTCVSVGGSAVGATGVREFWAETMARLRLWSLVGCCCRVHLVKSCTFGHGFYFDEQSGLQP